MHHLLGPRLVLWQVWSDTGPNGFFASRAEAEKFIERYYNVHLHPNETNWLVYTRENYGSTQHHPDGYQLWSGWDRHQVVHLERHELEATVASVARALNELPRHAKR